MKKLILLILVAGLLKFFWTQSQVKPKESIQEITNPVYGQVKVKESSSSDALEMMVLIKASDQMDCEKRIQAEGGVPTQICPTCRTESSECKTELPSRYAKLFDNEPTSLTYLSVARGSQVEREYRLIYWGLTVEQSDELCKAGIPMIQKINKGQVRCIPARRD